MTNREAPKEGEVWRDARGAEYKILYVGVPMGQMEDIVVIHCFNPIEDIEIGFLEARTLDWFMGAEMQDAISFVPHFQRIEQ